MSEEKKEKKPKASKGFMFPLILGMGLLFASWFFWPQCLIFFMQRYFKAFNSSINPMFVLTLYLFVLLLAAFVLARLFKRWPFFLGTFLPLAVYIGYQEWNSYHSLLHQYIGANGILMMLFSIFSKRSW